MPDAPELLTPRLLLRHWHPGDREPFAALNADPEVMEHFLSLLSRAESDTFVSRAEAGLTSRGYGLWAVEERATGTFLGFTGLNQVTFEAPFVDGPTVEIGWRLRRDAWGRGYAQEAARAVRDYAFGGAGLREIVSFTSTTNLRSSHVMERIGMTHDPADDFDHPRVPPGHRLRRHVLYRLAAPAPA
ncbi:MAG: GNAT family N-acetyltransferase [Candidatus Dormibacteraeota bacterium]|nr:GNAT family N-acetyltransferase [Candidatus Dormibacteraeota bacterium]